MRRQREARRSPPGARTAWLRPLTLLCGVALGLFALALGADFLADPERPGVATLLLRPAAGTALATLVTAAQIVAGMLAIVITVVAIVVELAANRYTHRITGLFLRERTNQWVLALYVVTTLLCLWLSWTYADGEGDLERPHVAMLAALGLVSFCLVLLLPYFAFVFAFLAPERVIGRIAAHTLDAVPAAEDPSQDFSERQLALVDGVDQLAEIGMGAIANRDRSIAIEAVDALHDVLLAYEERASSLPEPWFRLAAELADDPDFVAMTESLRASVSRRHLWVELKVVKQYRALLDATLNAVREVNHVITMRARSLGLFALTERRPALYDSIIKFFNSSLRAAINAGDVRTAYYVVHQYRRLAEHALEHGEPERAIAAAEHLRTYGLVSHAQGLRFVLETVAFDLSVLIEHACEAGSPAADLLLRVFLQVDKRGEGQDETLRGVRKAQIRLATFFLSRGEAARARAIFADLATDQRARLESIRDELALNEDPEYWELTDREENFSYLPPERRQRLAEFFAWFDGPAPSASAPGAARPDAR